jgi:hypothetical protein
LVLGRGFWGFLGDSVVDINVDNLVGGMIKDIPITLNPIAGLNSYDRSLMEKLKAIEALSDEKNALVKIIYSMLTKKLKKDLLDGK